MRSFLYRWIILLLSVGASYWLTISITPINWFGVLACICLGWLAYTVYTKRQFKWSLLSYIMTPVAIWASSLTLLIFMRKGPQEWLVIGTAAVLSWIWSTTLKKQEDEQDQAVFRGNLISYVNSFIIFFSASTLFAADIFISLKAYIAILIICTLSFMLHLQAMRASHISLAEAWRHSLVASIIITELYGALLFWPSSFLVLGLVITVVFYMFVGISRCILTSVLSRKLVTRYVTWGSFIIFAILVTADWQ